MGTHPERVRPSIALGWLAPPAGEWLSDDPETIHRSTPGFSVGWMEGVFALFR